MSVIASGNTTTTALIYTGDTTGNLVFTTGGANTTALTLNNVQSANFTGSLNSTNTFGFKNRIINGNMTIDQRNAGASVATTTTDNKTYTLDRWAYWNSTASKYTVQQNAGSVTPPAGYINYLGCTSTSAYSVAAGNYFMITQQIEGLNIADLDWGTANAKTITLSFQVYSSLTGTFGGALSNSAGNRSYPFTYTISSANTWTSISITIAGDTSGTWLTTSGIGIQVRIGLGVGSTYNGTAGAWAAANYISVTGATSVVGTNGATFYITGVQFEVGSQATSFDYRDYGAELIKCQRYCQANGGAVSNQILGVAWEYSTSGAVVACLLPVVMRTTPSLSYSAVGDWAVFSGGAGGPYAVTSIGLNRASPTSMSVEFVASSLTAGQAGVALANNTTNARIFLSAEL